MRLRAIKNHIIFQFIDEVDSKGQFVETTKWGFVIPGQFDNSAKSPRWGIVKEVGPEVKHVKVGQQVLINALKWTAGFKLDGVRNWRTDESQVAAVRKTPTSEMTALRDTIVFRRHDDPVNEAKHGLQVVGDAVVETPKGTVVLLGPDCVSELKNATIYYSEENFFNKFEHRGEKLWYLTEPEVLVYEPA
jgi:co-chaperonin GroES (HSP10)